jgi:hypothetical protein
MTKRRGIAILLLVTWVLLAGGPVAFAATGQCCPVCTKNMCPMKKPAQTSAMPCHDAASKSTCHMQAGTCSRDLDGLVFQFLAILPAAVFIAARVTSQIPGLSAKFKATFRIQNLAPPPKFTFA